MADLSKFGLCEDDPLSQNRSRINPVDSRDSDTQLMNRAAMTADPHSLTRAAMAAVPQSQNSLNSGNSETAKVRPIESDSSNREAMAAPPSAQTILKHGDSVTSSTPDPQIAGKSSVPNSRISSSSRDIQSPRDPSDANAANSKVKELGVSETAKFTRSATNSDMNFHNALNNLGEKHNNQNLNVIDNSVKTNNRTAPVKENRSYLNMLTGKATNCPTNQNFIPIKNGDVFTLSISDEYYATRLKVFDRALIGHSIYAKGDVPLPVSLLYEKLKLMWNLSSSSFRIISLGKGYYTLIFNNNEDFEKVWARRTWALSPGSFRLQPWTNDFNPDNVKMSYAQVWLRIYDLGCEFWEPELLSGIARAAGTPLKIDFHTLNGMYGHFARVLVEVDLSQQLPEKILFQRTDHSSFISLTYENLPDYCLHCECVGHKISMCRRVEANRIKRGRGGPESNKPHKKVVNNIAHGAVTSSNKNGFKGDTGYKRVEKINQINGTLGTKVKAGQNKGEIQMENRFATLGDLEDVDESSFVADSLQEGKGDTINEDQSHNDDSAINFANKEVVDTQKGEQQSEDKSENGPLEVLKALNKAPDHSLPNPVLDTVNRPSSNENSIAEKSKIEGQKNKEIGVNMTSAKFGSFFNLKVADIPRKPVRHVQTPRAGVTAEIPKSALQIAQDELERDGTLQNFVIADSFDSQKVSNMNKMARMNWADWKDDEEDE